MTIYQPRRSNISTYELSKDDLYRWADEVLKPAAELAFAGDGNYLCGEWCTFCKAKNDCRARADANLELARYEFKLPPLLTDEDIEEIHFSCQSGMLFITLPSGRRLAYVKPRIGENKFGGDCITYEGVGVTKKWERLESYGPKFVENIVQATSRDILCYAMKTLRNCCGGTHHCLWLR